MRAYGNIDFGTRVDTFHEWVSGLAPVLEGDLEQVFWQRQTEVDKLMSEHLEPENLTICMVGSTGAGKSTLLNAILGGRILPVSSMKACTSAVTEVSYEEGDVYTARIEFVSYDEWREEISLLLGDLEDASESPDSGEGLNEESISISKSARDKLKAVYKIEDIETMTLEELRNLEEPEEIREMLVDGWREASSYDLKKFCQYVAKFLSSKHEYWPLVKAVKMRGPFKALADGMTVVDLPGINDPNEARERVTRKYLKESRFVWIVFNVKRGPTKDITDLMKSDDFMRQIVMDGRADAMTFVGTSSDDADVESIIEDLEISDDVSDQEAILARNEAAKHEVRTTLEDLGSDLRNRSSHISQHMDTILRQLKDSSIFTVSSMQFMRNWVCT
jgi:GTPase SAR1 family protein